MSEFLRNTTLAEELHATKNDPKVVSTLTVGSGKKVWWQCDKGHEWEASVKNRYGLKRGCPVCANKKISIGYNDFESQAPDYIKQEWDYSKNVFLPTELTVSSHKKVWWKCDKGHAWEATAANRIVSGTNCPICSGNKVLPGFNDLATTHPIFIKYWSAKNKTKIDSISKGSTKKIILLCEENHEWISTADNFIKTPTCPYCEGRKILSGFNDLATKYPSIAAQWHPTNNNKLKPHQILPSYKNKLWWKCDKGHEWETGLRKRIEGAGCHYCSSYKVLKGFNDLESASFYTPKEWHPTKNGKLASEITSHSGRKMWWQCDKGHEWEATAASRAMGNKCPVCSNKKLVIGINDANTLYPLLKKEFSKKNNFDFNDMIAGSAKKAWWVCDKGHEWETGLRKRVLGTQCPFCIAKQFVSKPEKEIGIYLKTLFPHMNIETTVRNISGINELDLYIPDKKIAIEFNGLYWHSEKFKTKNYHYNKWLACKEKGIQLIQIWEDDWNRNPNLIKTLLTQKLGVASSGSTVYARNTVAMLITKSYAESFLKNYHIQGYSQGSYYLGLFDKRDIEKLVAVLVLKKEPGTEGKTLNIIRYATSCNVPGGFTKLLKYAEITYKPESFITFSDNTVSNGGLYENNGFIADKELAPDYTYLVKGERKHKFGYRLKRFRNDPELQYQPGLTERELAALNGLHRVWDAGKTRWARLVV